MEKETTSFWTDIKKYEDILAKDPRSYCFAPLSELYRKLGLLDDALAVAKRGTEAHPEYIGGYMALGRALFEMGNRDEAKVSLEKVALATPENLLAQKLLSQIYQEEGNLPAAEKALKVLVAFNPEDTESTLSLEVLQRSMQSIGEPSPVDELTVADPVTNIDEADMSVSPVADELEQAPIATEMIEQDWADFPVVPEEEEQTIPDDPGIMTQAAPLSTVTLAELYEAQGFYEKAREVYSELLEKDPESKALQERLSALNLRIDYGSNSIQLTDVEGAGEPSVSVGIPDYGVQTLDLSCNGAESSKNLCGEEQMLETLEVLLAAVRRRKECR